ncbi:RAB GDP-DISSOCIATION INHIBITOR, partial [Salix purpurea]
MTRKKFSVFEFDEEEEDGVEKVSAKFSGKFRIQKRKRNDNRKGDGSSSPITKYKFLQCFGGCTEAAKIERSNEPINIDDGPIDVDTGGETDALRKGKSDEVVDIDTIIIDKQCQYSVSVRARMPQEHCADKDEISQMVTFMIDEDDGPIDVDTRVAGEINPLCKGKSDEVVDIDTTILDDQSECFVSVPARMSQEDCVVKEEISKLGTLGIDIDDGPIDVAIGVPACMPPEDCDDNEISQLDTLRLSSFSNSENESASMISDNDVRIEMSSSTSVFTPSEDEGNQVLECGSLGHQIVEFDESGKAIGVTSEGETAKCKKVVCDPSYLPNKVKKVGKKQLGRKSDMYLFCCSYAHNVAPKGKYIACVSNEAETDNPEVELRPGTDLLGQVDEIFYDSYVPANEEEDDNCFIST